MFNLLYVMHLDDEEYPYWVGASGRLSPDPRDTPLWSQAYAADEGWRYGQEHEELEQWCLSFASRGFDYKVSHDAFNGSHQVYQFLSRIDAMRFALLEIMTNKIITA